MKKRNLTLFSILALVIHFLDFSIADEKTENIRGIKKVKRINKPYARKIQILTVLEQRAAVQGKAEQSRLAKKAKETLRKQRGTSKKST